MIATARKTEPIAEAAEAAEALPVEERIRQRAYDLYAMRGNESGSELEDWLEAEQEIIGSAEPDGRAAK